MDPLRGRTGLPSTPSIGPQSAPSARCQLLFDKTADSTQGIARRTVFDSLSPDPTEVITRIGAFHVERPDPARRSGRPFARCHGLMA